MVDNWTQDAVWKIDASNIRERHSGKFFITSEFIIFLNFYMQRCGRVLFAIPIFGQRFAVRIRLRMHWLHDVWQGRKSSGMWLINIFLDTINNWKRDFLTNSNFTWLEMTFQCRILCSDHLNDGFLPRLRRRARARRRSRTPRRKPRLKPPLRPSKTFETWHLLVSKI